MSPAEKLISELVLRTVETMPAGDRAEYYRALASLCSDDAVVVQLAELATECDAIAKKHRQLVLDFRRGGKGGRA